MKHLVCALFGHIDSDPEPHPDFTHFAGCRRCGYVKAFHGWVRWPRKDAHA